VFGECLLSSSFKGMYLRLSQATRGESVPFVDVVWMQFLFYYFPHNLVHAPRFSDKDTGVVGGGGKFNNCMEQKPKTILPFHQQQPQNPKNLYRLKNTV
jgi:hypothetical protein